MVDGVLHLTDELSELRPLRHIRVLKLRGSAPVRGLHSVRITDKGFEVRPRIETRLPQGAVDEERGRVGPEAARSESASSTTMLRGGVRPGSITMLLGSSGSGKTLLGMQFLSEGVKRGERVVYFGFYERPGSDSGEMPARRHRRTEGRRRARPGADRLASAGRRRDRRTRREPDPDRPDACGRSGCSSTGWRALNAPPIFPSGCRMSTAPSPRNWNGSASPTLYTTETRELFARTIEVPINGLSAATQNIILLRHIEHRAAMLRVLAILKVRDDDYDARMRELQITDDGIRLLDTFAAESGVASGGGVSSDMRTDRRRGIADAVPTSRSILIVDDEFGLAEMLREMLREYGYDVTLAINGRLALDILGERTDRPGHHRHDDAGDGRRRSWRPRCARAEPIATSRSS